MHIYRIKLRLAEGGRVSYLGLFVDGCEAVLQALADWPDARAVSAICLRRGVAS